MKAILMLRRSRTFWIALAGLLACAVLSWFKGQDTNWDQLNYHRYVGWAFFHDRLPLDLAAAGMQSYFNPGLDIPLYWLYEHLPGWAVGLIIGAWHGLVFVLTLLIAREVWPRASSRGLLLTTAAGVLAPVFWAGLGNSMGDNAGAVFVLAALWCLLRSMRGVPGASLASPPGMAGRARWVLAAGVLLGLCTGLKLTNAPLAVAMGVAAMLHAGSVGASVRVLALLLPAGLLGFALGGGWWFHEVWLRFGNPLFPQFSRLFPSALTESVSVMDQRFIPDGLGGLLLRPVLMLLNYRITSEFFVLPLLWPLWFSIGLAALLSLARERLGQAAPSPARARWTSPQGMVLTFVLLGVLLWARLFGIYRYTAALEPLLPLCMVLMLARMGIGGHGEQGTGMNVWLKRAFMLSMVCTVCGGSVNWGHAAWAERSFRPDGEVSVQGARPLVLTVGIGNSWVLPFLGTRPRYASVGAYAAFSKGYDDEIARLVHAADKVYAVVGMSQNWRFDVVDKANDALGAVGVLDSVGACDGLARAIARTRPHAGVTRCEGASCEGRRCMLTKLPGDQAEVDRRDAQALDDARAILRAHGLALSENASPACSLRGAYIGGKRYPFRLCELKVVPDGP